MNLQHVTLIHRINIDASADTAANTVLVAVIGNQIVFIILFTYECYKYNQNSVPLIVLTEILMNIPTETSNMKPYTNRGILWMSFNVDDAVMMNCSAN